MMDSNNNSSPNIFTPSSGFEMRLVYIILISSIFLLSPIPGLTTIASSITLIALSIFIIKYRDLLDKTTIKLSLSITPYFLWVIASYFWTIDSPKGFTVISTTTTSIFVFLASICYGSAIKKSGLIGFAIIMLISIHILFAAMQYTSNPHIRLTGLTNNANLLAFILLTLWIMLVFIGKPSSKAHGYIVKLLLSASTVAILINTASKKAVPGVIVVFLAIFLRSKTTFRRSIIFMTTIFITLLFYWISNPSISNNIIDTAQDTRLYQRFDAYLKGTGEDWVRADMKRESYSLFIERPLLGYGADSYSILGSYGTYSHNNYTETLVSFGIPGLIFFFLPVVISLILKNYTFSGYLILIFLLIWQWGAVVIDTKIYWWVVGALIASQPEREKRIKPKDKAGALLETLTAKL